MKTFPLATLGNFRTNQKFLWNNTIYTVYQHEDQMTEVFGNGRFWVWYSNIKVTPVLV